jgi:hypothetical protein
VEALIAGIVIGLVSGVAFDRVMLVPWVDHANKRARRGA